MPRVLWKALILIVATLVLAPLASARVPVISRSLIPPVILRGTVVTPDAVVEDGLVTITGSKIASVTPFASADPGLDYIDTGSYIVPGLIDLHNHSTWNVLPRWHHKTFESREAWVGSQAYEEAMVGPYRAIAKNLGCEADIYGDVKAVVGGATSTIGSRRVPACIQGLVRNLDKAPGFVNAMTPTVLYNVFPFDANSTVALQDALNVLDAGGKYIIHAAEGKMGSVSAGDFDEMVNEGLLRAGVSIVHGVALSTREFKAMSEKGVGLIWSPRSDIDLYGQTADVQAAKAAHVRIALAPDWSPTGSNGILEEMNYARSWDKTGIFTDRDLVRMTTVVPAQIVGLDGLVGSVSAGHFADLLLIRKLPGASGSMSLVYQAIVQSGPADIRLVVIGGVSIYGDLDLMNKTSHGGALETITVCGTRKALNTATGAFLSYHPPPSSAHAPFSWISGVLDDTLLTYRTHLGSLAGCDE